MKEFAKWRHHQSCIMRAFVDATTAHCLTTIFKIDVLFCEPIFTIFLNLLPLFNPPTPQ